MILTMAYRMYLTKLTKESKEVAALEDLLGLLDIPRFRSNLRALLFQYLMDQHQCLLPDFEHFIEDMRFFFEFLDVLNEETEEMGVFEKDVE